MGRRWSTRTRRRTSPTPGRSSPARPAPARRSTTCCRRRGHRQAPVHPAAAHPGVHGAAFDRRAAGWRRHHAVVSDADPAHPADVGRPDARHPRAEGAGHRPGRRRRVRRQDPGDAGGVHLHHGRPQAGQAGEVHRVALRVADVGHHGRDQIQDITHHRQTGRHGHRPGRAPARRHGRLPAPGRAGRADPRRVHVQRDLQVPGLPVRVRRRLHDQDADRRLPRRRSARGDLRHRTDHGRARGRAGHGPDGAAPQELDQPRGVPVHHGLRAHLRQRQLRGGDRQGARADRVGRAARRAGRAARRRDPVQLGLGISTFTEMCGWAPSRVLGSLGYGAGGWEHASVRVLPTGKVEVVTGASPHGQGHETAFEPDRGRPARRRRSRTSSSSTATPSLAQGAGHLRLAFAGRRRHRHRQRGRQGDREGQADRRAHAGGERGRPRVRQRLVQRQGRAWHRQDASATSPSRRSRRTTCPTASSRRSTPTPPSTRSTSRSRTAPTCARSRSTPRPGWSRSASTSASTTSASRSTR